MSYSWEECFPYPEFRPNQAETIDKIINQFESGKKFEILEAPTGMGKSAVGYTIGRYFENYYYITAQKILQNQLVNDFGFGGKWTKPEHAMADLKGRNAYECTFYKEALADPSYKMSRERRQYLEKKSKEYVDCSVGECKKQGKSRLDFCDKRCPYFIKYNAAIRSDPVLMNFHSFIFQTEFTAKWPYKSLLIIDEAHNTEQVLMDFISFTFNDLKYDFDIPRYDNAEEYYLFFEDIDIKSIIRNHILVAVKDGDAKLEEYWIQQASKYMKFSESIQKHDWVSKWEKKEIARGGTKYATVELKPLYVKDFAHDLLFDKVDKVLMMSATILSVDIMCDSLGINRSQVHASRLASDFPVENRPILFKPSGKMSYKEKATTMPKLMKDIEKITSSHSDHKGIIHTHNFEIASYIKEKGSRELRIRLYFQNDYSSKEDMLEAHAKSDNGIIIAPAMHEGLDLKDDLSRFQIICKMPYPGLGNNPQLKRRMELSSEYYAYLTALKLVQSYGRSVRSADDWAKTYVLDADFKSFYDRSKHLLPKWFKEAIVWK